MIKHQEFSMNNISYRVVEIKNNDEEFTVQTGYTHRAELLRISNRRVQSAYLTIVDEQVSHIRFMTGTTKDQYAGNNIDPLTSKASK